MTIIRFKSARVIILVAISLLKISTIIAQRYESNTWFHSFLNTKFGSFGIQKIAIYCAQEDFNPEHVISPGINLENKYEFKNNGDKDVIAYLNNELKKQFENIGYQTSILNSKINSSTVSLSEIFNLAIKENSDAVCIFHYNLFNHWKFYNAYSKTEYWMKKVTAPEEVSDRIYYSGGYLIKPNLYIYELKTKNLVYRGINYGNNGEKYVDPVLSEMTHPFDKSDAAVNAVKTIFNYTGSDFSKKYDELTYYPVPKAKEKDIHGSSSYKKEELFWERYLNLEPYVGLFPLEFGLKFNFTKDPGTHIFKQWSLIFANTRFSPDASVYGAYISADYTINKSKWKFKRLSTNLGFIIGVAYGKKQTLSLTQQTGTGRPPFFAQTEVVSEETRTPMRSLVALTGYFELLLTKNIALGLRASPGVDTQNYFEDIEMPYSDDIDDEFINDYHDVQTFGIPIHLSLKLYL